MSRHRLAHDNAEYQAALRREPKSARVFCTRCHAPEGVGGAEHVGVGCVTCHVPLGPVLASPTRSAAGAPAHPVLRLAEMQNGEACARCHEFAFPPPNEKGRMQRTMTEHRVAAGMTLGCNGCHMPMVGKGSKRHRSHAFPGGHDAALVKSSLDVKASRSTAARVSIRLTPKNVTHAVPTGDLFRRIAVKLAGPGGQSRVRYLTRRFRDALPHRTEVADDRPYRTPTLVELAVPPAARNGAVHYQVVYERVSHPRGSEQDAVLDGVIVIAEGYLAPP